MCKNVHIHLIYQKRITDMLFSRKYKVHRLSTLRQSFKRNINQQPGDITHVSHASCMHRADQKRLGGFLKWHTVISSDAVFLNFVNLQHLGISTHFLRNGIPSKFLFNYIAPHSIHKILMIKPTNLILISSST